MPRKRSPDGTNHRIAERNRKKILAAAEEVFAKHGFRGSRLGEIAEAANLPKANLLYYFRTKEAIYRTVITDILKVWLDALGEISADDDAATALSQYIRSKMMLSRKRPNASKIFATEVIAGAPIIGDYLKNDLRDWVDRQSAVFEAWQGRGEMAPVPPTHVFFMIWAATQTYADFDTQISSVIGKKKLDAQEFETAIETVTAIMLTGLGVKKNK